MKINRQQPSYSVSQLMWDTLSSLCNDYHSLLPGHLARSLSLLCDDRDLTGVRSLEIDEQWFTDKNVFKRVYQVLTLFKRVTFEKRDLSFSDLERIAECKFIENQKRLGAFILDVPKHFGTALSRARGACYEILAEWDNEEFLALCRMGRHAAVGVPLRKASLDAKWKPPLSGSLDHIEWFRRQYLPYHRLARESCAWDDSCFTPCDSLQMTFVPKSFKSVRSIMPNTVIGALHSDGIGRMITKRLKRAGLDITTLQSYHRDLAQFASLDGELATCDQSSASDNITVELARYLLPPAWFNAIMVGRLDKVKLPSGEQIDLMSLCTMGIGFTFPLQTLIFYSLALGIDSQFNAEQGLISCYGDDLIFPNGNFLFFEKFATHCGLLINHDKSFYTGLFRESCGGDYYHGMDVRPFQPKWVGPDRVRKDAFESLLYYLFNGLRRRWDDTEIPSTLALLARYIRSTVKEACICPSIFSEKSGILVDSVGEAELLGFDTSHMKRNRNGASIFTYLRSTTKEVEVSSCDPFYWRSLQEVKTIERSSQPQYKDSPPSLRWRENHGTLVPFSGIAGDGKVHRHRSVTVLL